MLKARTKVSKPEEECTTIVVDSSLVDEYWLEMESLVVSGLKCSRGELIAADVYVMIKRQEATAFLVLQDGRIELVLIAEIVRFPRVLKANIVLLAGKNTRKASQFLPAFEQWALAFNAVEITGYAPAMGGHSRLYRRLGFEVAYHVVARDLRRKLQ